MTDAVREPGSFRDPANAVFYAGGRVFRGLGEKGATDWKRLEETRFFAAAVAAGRVVGTRAVDPDEVPGSPGGLAAVLEHEPIPFVSYPYEWTFEMLRDAAVLHLELLLAALDEGMTTKDGYAFNVQWCGARPVFIDVGSFEVAGPGPWVGYRQFCQTFLYPLLLEAHVGVPFQRFLLGSLDGLDPTDMRRLLAGHHVLKKGVLRNVLLHSLAESRVTQGGRQIQDDLGRAGFGVELTKATVTKLLALVRSLRSRRADSGWKTYRETCTYSDADRARKQRFVEECLQGLEVRTAWDLGANDGAYARIVAERGAYVVALDADDVTVDSLYRSLRARQDERIQPMVMNLVDPSPARGWRGQERRAFTDRGSPDLVLALALVHHLAIAANVPLPEVTDWLASLGGTLVVEFVEPHDPMAQRLLANKPEGLFPDYRIDAFQTLLERRFTIERREQLPSGSRTLYLARPRT